MMLMQEYKADLIDHIENEADSTFTNAHKSKAAILNDNNTMEQLWILYQKAVQEYNVNPYQAFREALADVCAIPEPKTYETHENEG